MDKKEYDKVRMENYLNKKINSFDLLFIKLYVEILGKYPVLTE